MQTNVDSQQIKSWLRTAQPDELVEVGLALNSQIVSAPQQHRDRYFAQLKSDPTFSREFEKTTTV